MVFDVEHGGPFLRGLTDDRAVTGFWSTLQKAGFFVVSNEGLDDGWRERAAAVFYCAPSVAFGSAEVEELLDFMTGGGLVILGTGYEEAGPSEALLAALELRVLPVPLGAIPILESSRRLLHDGPLFTEAWPIGSRGDGDPDPRYRARAGDVVYEEEPGEGPVVLFRREGEGGLLLIADSRFLENKNVEGTDLGVSANVRFLQSVLTDLGERGVVR